MHTFDGDCSIWWLECKSVTRADGGVADDKGNFDSILYKQMILM